MALTSNQGLILPDGTDNANVPLSFSELVTTAGSGLENRLVQRYLSAADRTARNPAPNEGELSYLLDVNVYETFTGVAWQSITKGFVVDLNRQVNSASFTTTETVLDFVTFTAVANARYKLSWNGNLRTTVANDTGRLIFRFQAGGVLTTAGTPFYIYTLAFANAGAVGTKELYPFTAVSGLPAGLMSIGVTSIRDTGTGTWTSIGSGNQQVVTLLEQV